MRVPGLPPSARVARTRMTSADIRARVYSALQTRSHRLQSAAKVLGLASDCVAPNAVIQASIVADDFTEGVRDPQVAAKPREEEAETQVVDWRRVDPGPEVRDVGFALTCGSCTKFVALNDPRRRNPAQMDAWLQKPHCPRLVLEDIRVPVGRQAEDCVPRADMRACDRYVLNKAVAALSTDNFLGVLEDLAKLPRQEIDVMAVLLQRIYRRKTYEEKCGYSIGERLVVPYQSRKISVEVVGFQRRRGAEVLVQGVEAKSTRFAIPARTIVELDENEAGEFFF